MDHGLSASFQKYQLHQAAEEGVLDTVKQLLRRKYPVNRFDELGKTPLHYAVSSGHIEVAACLIRAGANVNAHDERQIGNTPLADSAETCSAAMVRLLLEAGADAAIPGWMQMNALHRAATRKDAEAKEVQRLLREGCTRRR